MQSLFFESFFAVLLVSLMPILGFVFVFHEKHKDKMVFFFVSLAVGALFGDALIHMLPDVFERANGHTFIPSLIVVLGFLVMFVLEKFLHWHHEHSEEHSEECRDNIKPLGKISLISDALHNFIDGVTITASFAISLEVGLATTLAVTLHEIPHELGNVAILIHAGYSKGRAIFFNFISALTAMFGFILTFALLTQVSNLIYWVIPFAAGNFIYIAASDLVPELHKNLEFNKSVIQFIGIILGVVLMALALMLE